MNVKDYSKYSLAIYGDTKTHKDALKNLGAKFNKNLADGPGWILSKKKEQELLEIINNINPSKMELYTYYMQVPILNNRVTIVTDGNEVSGTITSVKEKSPADKFTFSTETGEILEIVVISGEWKINGKLDPHTVVFN